jgi:hypothetical protein
MRVEKPLAYYDALCELQRNMYDATSYESVDIRPDHYAISDGLDVYTLDFKIVISDRLRKALTGVSGRIFRSFQLVC